MKILKSEKSGVLVNKKLGTILRFDFKMSYYKNEISGGAKFVNEKNEGFNEVETEIGEEFYDEDSD